VPFCVEKGQPLSKETIKIHSLSCPYNWAENKKGRDFFRSKLVFRVGQMTNCTISNIKFKVAHCCVVVVYALSFSRNWLKVFFFMQRFCWALWNQLMIQQKCNGYCCVAEKKCELATKMKASNLSLQYLQALFYFAITSIQATSFFLFFWCCSRGRTPVDWTKQRKATSALSKFVCYRTTFTVFVGCFFSFYFLWCVYKSSRCDLWSANEFLVNLWLETYRFKKGAFSCVCLVSINFFSFFRRKKVVKNVVTGNLDWYIWFFLQVVVV